MSTHQHPPLQKESAHDLAQHQATYDGFVNLIKWAVGGIAVLLIILYFVVKP
jgi:hypothetical protein